MPNWRTSASLVETAAKWRATAAGSPPSFASSQSRAEPALVMVSWVVKVLDATMNRVRSGSRPLRVSARWALSTLETKCARRPLVA